MSDQIYSTARVYFGLAPTEGNSSALSLLTEMADVSVKVNGNHQDVKTLAKGWAGISEGAVMTEITITNKVPSNGFEVEVLPLINELARVTLGLFMGGQLLTVTGYIMSADLDKSVDADAKQSFVFHTGPSRFE